MRAHESMLSGAALLAALLVSTSALAAEGKAEVTGKDLAMNNKKGNCIACHAMPTVSDAEDPGEAGPPLVAMSARYPDKQALRAKIFDATSNPNTFMPPFGKHKILTEDELNKVVDFVYGL